MDVALAVTIGNPDVSVAIVALFVHGDPGRGIHALAVDIEVRLLQTGQNVAFQVHLQHLAAHLAAGIIVADVR